MQAGKLVRADFSAGELGPEMAGRFDIPQYHSALARLENAVTMPQGGIRKMPGTTYLGEAKDMSHPVRLMSYIYNSDYSYMFEFGHLYLRIWKQDGTVLQDDLVTPWAGADLRKIQRGGFEEVGYYVCKGYRPQKITFTPSTESFAISEPTFITDTDPQSSTYTPEQQFHLEDYWPSVASFYEERLILSSTPNNPATVFGSKTGLPEDFTLGENDDMAYAHNIASRDASPVLWIDAYGVMIIATATAEFTLRGGNIGITPSSFLIRAESTYGSSEVEGKLYGDAVIFLQRHGTRIREYTYQDNQSPYLGMELSMAAPHICKPRAVETTHIQDPWGIIWFTRSDGVLVGMTRERGGDQLSFHRHTTDGQYESVVGLAASDRDQLWAVVIREIDGATVRYIERFDSMQNKPLETGVYTHSALTLNLGDAVEITAVATANPLVVTAPGHTWEVGDYLRFTGVEGTVEMNGVTFRVEAVTGDDLTLGFSDGTGNVDASSWDAYVEGGSAEKVVETITGLGHLEGKIVAVLADGGIHAPRMVVSGSISLERWSNTTIVGLPYRAIAETMPGALGALSRMTNMAGRFDHTVGCLVGDDETTLREMLWLTSGEDLYLGPAPLFTGDKKDLFPGHTKPVESVVIANDYPLPWTVLALTVDAVRSTEV